MLIKRRVWVLALWTVAIIIAACGTEPRPRLGEQVRQVPDGDPGLGRTAILDYGCGTCHTIPGIPGANAHVGPPLNVFDQRHYIAGTLLNDASNLIIWIQNPQEIRPGTAMPDLNITEEEARHIAAFLYSSTR